MKFLYALLMLGLLACGKDSDSNSGDAVQVLGKSARVLESEQLEITEESATGTGSFLFVDPAGEQSASKSFTYVFTVQDGGSVQLSAFATASEFESGALVTVTRSGSKVSLSVGSKVVAEKANVNDGTVHSVTVDVHNGEGHVLVWYNETSEFDEDTAWWHSELAGAEVEEDTLKGTGTFWGFKMADAVITKADVADEKLEHHHD